MNKGDIVYWARIIPGVSYNCYELKIRNVKENWFVGIEKTDKQAFLLGMDTLDRTVFYERKKALAVVKAAEKQWEQI